jgi:hypothetical protein
MQVNLPYITWVAAFNTSFLLGYILLDLIFFPSPLSKSVYSPTSKLKVQPDSVLLSRDTRHDRGADGTATAPVLLEAINRNGLALFLLVGNVPPVARGCGCREVPFMLNLSLLGECCDRPRQPHDPYYGRL